MYTPRIPPQPSLPVFSQILIYSNNLIVPSPPSIPLVAALLPLLSLFPSLETPKPDRIESKSEVRRRSRRIEDRRQKEGDRRTPRGPGIVTSDPRRSSPRSPLPAAEDPHSPIQPTVDSTRDKIGTDQTGEYESGQGERLFRQPTPISPLPYPGRASPLFASSQVTPPAFRDVLPSQKPRVLETQTRDAEHRKALRRRLVVSPASPGLELLYTGGARGVKQKGSAFSPVSPLALAVPAPPPPVI
ncbi:hypothetical protein FA13DRAFT_288418 [Coprinellus micaceus]|uniref:Uncharacterized protein n=1 Tax=Coprinellus micaceus TaxID=71717 RepID=A0A4Y7TDD7_COPMI|nr:hypothetical protein FA13DRAFT_288418 [Coprinellus micaceus]